MLSSARKFKPAEELKLDESLSKIIVSSVNKTFSALFNINPAFQEILIHDKNIKLHNEITGVVGFIQEKIEGTLSVCFAQKTLLAMMAKFYNKPMDTITDSVVGGIGEMSNIIHGLIRKELNLQGFDFKMCLPLIVIGNTHKIFSTVKSEKMVLSFSTEFGPFYVEIDIHRSIDSN